MSFGHDAYAENPFAVAGAVITQSFSRSTWDSLKFGTIPAGSYNDLTGGAAGTTPATTDPGAPTAFSAVTTTGGTCTRDDTVKVGSYRALKFTPSSSSKISVRFGLASTHQVVAHGYYTASAQVVSAGIDYVELITFYAGSTAQAGIGLIANSAQMTLTLIRNNPGPTNLNIGAHLSTGVVYRMEVWLDTSTLDPSTSIFGYSVYRVDGDTETLHETTSFNGAFVDVTAITGVEFGSVVTSGVTPGAFTLGALAAKTGTITEIGQYTDPVSASTANVGFSRTASDNATVSDAAVGVISGHLRTTSDSVPVSDAVDRVVALPRSTSDQLGVGAPANPVIIMGTPTNTAASLTHPISVVIPSGARVNDRAYLVVAVNSGTAAPTVSGWTKIFDSGSQISNTATLVIYSRDALIQLGDAGSALSFEWGTARSQDAVIFTTDGDFDVISAATVQSSLTSTVPVPAITPADANALWLQIALVQPTSGTTVTGTQPSGFTEILDDTPTQGAALNDSLYISKKQLSGQAGTLQAATTSTPSANAKAVVVSMTIAPSYHVKDTASRSVADSRSVSDSVPVSEAVARALVLPRATSDNATVTEAPTTAPQSFTRTASDTVGTSCAATRAVADSRSGSDTIGVSEVVARAFALSRATADSVPVSEVVTRTLVFARATADTIGTSCVGALTGTESRATSDNATISEAVTRALAYSRAASETATVSEVVARSMLLPRAPSDSVVLTDAVARTLVLHRSTSDSAVVSDVATGSVSTAAGAQSRSSTDTIGVSDAVSAHVTLARSTADSAVVSEAATRAAQTFLRTAVDSAAVVDVAAPAVVLHASATDTITFSDAGVAHVHRFRTATDTLGPSDDVARSIALVGRATDSAAVTDVASPRVFLHVSAADALALSEAAAVSLLLLRTAVDTLGIDDAADGIFIPHPIDVEAFDPQVLVVGLTCGLTLVTPLPAIELLTGSAAMELVGVSTDATLASPSTEVDVVAEDLTL